MYQTHPSFTAPRSEDIKIWRYLDIAKFAYMISKKNLYFPKASKLEDAFEGSYTKKSVDTRSEFFKSVARGNPNLNIERQISEFAKQIREHVYISSWHMNSHESAAMWNLYSQGGKGIAIQSTFKGLKNSFKNLKEDIFIGKVKYIDYDKDLIDTKNLLNPFIRKRKSFEYEYELRVILARLSEASFRPKSENDNSPDGIYLEVDLDKLIESVYISQTSKDWEIDLVNILMENFQLRKPLIMSSLSANPLY